MNEFLSNKFKWLSVIATWGVVVSHSHTGSWTPGISTCASTIQSHIVDLMWWPVPLFFVISGYLFCISYEKYGWKGVLHRKFNSLYVPAVVWIFLGELLILPILLYLHKLPCWQAVLGSFALMVDQRAWPVYGGMYGGMLWYVRDLLVFFLVSPVLYGLGRLRWGGVGLSLFVFVGAYFVWPQPRMLWRYDFGFITHDLIFICIGMALYHTRAALRQIDAIVSVWTTVCLLLGFCVGEIYLGRGSDWWWLANRAVPAAIFWFGYDVVDGYVGGLRKCPSYLMCMFFVYCFHEVPIKYISGVLRCGLGTEDWVRHIAFALNSMSFFFCVFAAWLTRKVSEKVYGILSGGR